jgi:hypothetical protein
MTKFADQLFDDLMREHGSALAQTRAPAPKRHTAPRRTLIAAGVGVLAAAATAGGLMASGGGAPAYALTTHPDGTVTLDVYTESGIAGINTKLHQVGDDQVVVVPVGAGCPSISSLPAPAVPPSGHIAVGRWVGGQRLGDRARPGHPGRRHPRSGRRDPHHREHALRDEHGEADVPSGAGLREPALTAPGQRHHHRRIRVGDH